MILRRINLSAAIIVLACFFLPWVQISCGGARNTLSGLDLARNDHASLWLIPVLMAVLLLLALARAWKAQPRAYAMASAICGGISAYLMNREEVRFGVGVGVISAQLTVWFRLGFFSSLFMVLSGLVILVRGGGARSTQK